MMSSWAFNLTIVSLKIQQDACKARIWQQKEYLVAPVVQDYALRIVSFYISNNVQTVVHQLNKFSLICQTEF